MLAGVVSSPRRSVTSSTQCPRLSPLRAASGTGSSRCTCIIARVAVSTRLGQSISRASGRGRGSANFAPEDFVTRGDNLWQNTVAPQKKRPSHEKVTSDRPVLQKEFHIILPIFKLYFNGCPFTYISSKCGFPLGFLPKLYACLFSPICDTCAIRQILLDLIALTISDEDYRSWSSSLCNFILLLVPSHISGLWVK